MLRTFNCGIGMVVVAGRDQAVEVQAAFMAEGETALKIGEVVAAKEGAPRVATHGHLAL
jgi:phosphoribosylformylglycinamidine cyclo-ligase